MSDPRPNVMLVIGEDIGLYLSCYGRAECPTPTFDRLAAEGMRVHHAFSHTPVCAPSRSGLVTGRYPYSYGAHQMRSTLLDPPPMFTRALKQAGYQVSWPSKTDFNFEMPAADISDTANWTTNALPKDGPWFCYTNLAPTHESCMWPDDLKPEGVAARARLQAHERVDPASVTVPPYLPDTPEVRIDIARHCENARVIDFMMADLLALLDASGQADNTIVIFLSDHGPGIPRGKRWCYDLGVRMPLLVRWPGKIAPETVHTGLVGWVDIAPQILAWCGVNQPAGLQGRVWHGEDISTPERAFCFGGRDRMDEQFEHIRFARSQRYLYIRNFSHHLPYAQRNRYMETMPSMQVWRRMHAEGSLTPQQAAWFADHKPEEELYDCLTDPWQMHNLAEDPDHQAILASHRSALETHLSEVGDLGATSEWELIEQGLVADRISEEYRSRIQPLPEPYDNLGGPWDVDGTLWSADKMPAPTEAG